MKFVLFSILPKMFEKLLALHTTVGGASVVATWVAWRAVLSRVALVMSLEV